eukprot:310957-Pleurochrysis_carterae.AAC.1
MDGYRQSRVVHCRVERREVGSWWACSVLLPRMRRAGACVAPRQLSLRSVETAELASRRDS